MKRLIPMFMGSMTAACLGGSGESLTFEEAKVLAPMVGHELAPVVEDGDARVAASDGSLETKRAIFAELFGPQLAKIEEGDGSVRFGDAFRITGFEVAESIDGRPALLTWSLTGGQAFFYEPTVLDVRTGAIYQGSFMGSEEIEFFGPLMPASRIVGTFTPEELWEIDGLVRSTLHEASPE